MKTYQYSCFVGLGGKFSLSIIDFTETSTAIFSSLDYETMKFMSGLLLDNKLTSCLTQSHGDFDLAPYYMVATIDKPFLTDFMDFILPFVKQTFNIEIEP